MAYDAGVPRDPLVCVLGMVDERQLYESGKYVFSRLLYIARILISLHWLSEDPSTRSKFISRVNSLLHF